MSVPIEILLPMLMWIPLVSVLLNFLLIVFLIIFIQKGKLKGREQQEIEDEIMETLKQTDKRAIEMLEKAAERAKQIVSEAEGTKQLLNQKIDILVNDTADIAQNQLDQEKGIILEKFKASYTNLVDLIQGESQTLMASLQHDAREIRKGFAESMQNATVGVLRELKVDAEKQLITVDNEIKDYRDNTFKKIDEHAQSIIKQIVAEYFDTQVSPNTQESILTKAFEKFKQHLPHP